MLKEIVQAMTDAGMIEALNSTEAFKEAAKKLHFSDEQIQEALDELADQVLNDAELSNVSGGCGHTYNPSPK